jgi:hypothetical protein
MANSTMRIENTVPPGLIVTCRPSAEPLAVTVTVAVAPALIVPPEGLSWTVPEPLDTVLDQVTGPPCAFSEIVVPPGGTHSVPPDGETERVPGVALTVGVAVDAEAEGAGSVVVDGGAAGVVACFAAVGVPGGAVVAEPVGFAVALVAAWVAAWVAEFLGEVPGEAPGDAPNGAAAEAPVGGAESAGCPAACFPWPGLSVSTTATVPMTAAATRPAATATIPLRLAERPLSPRAGASFGSGGGLGKPWESNIPA